MLLSLHHFFVIWVKDPNGEKEIKVLGVGFGERPFFKRVLPNYAVYTPRQTLILLVNNKKAESDKALCLGYSNLLHRLHDQILRCLGRKRSAPDKALDKIAADTAQRFELFGLLNAL